MAAVASPCRRGFVSRFRSNVVGLVALSVLAGCSHLSRSEEPAVRGPVEHASRAKPDGAPTAPEAVASEPLASPAPAAEAERKEAPQESLADAAASPPSVSGLGRGGGGIGTQGGIGLGRASSGAPVKMAAKRRGGGVLAPSPGLSPAAADEGMNTEGYAHVAESAFVSVASQPLSTFSIDVDTASYSNSRRFLTQGQLPPKDAIRLEEWVNYFSYDYAKPSGDAPFAVSTEVTSCPWNPKHQLVRIGIKGRELSQDQVPPRNLVFLLDVSGSMTSPDKLPLVKRGLSLLTDSLRPQDSIAIVVYAGSSGLVLPATSGRERGKILRALEGLDAGGSTNGGEGIELAYSVAQAQFRKGGINRVILATDGDFNVGTTSQGELTRLIEEKRKGGVFLTVLGFGSGNTKDSTMELLADKGNGNYAYIDTLAEARKVLVREAGSTLVTIAKDVKLQVELNPSKVQSYKLIGYENRLLAAQDFNDDKKDAGEIGAGHTVTALYELVPRGVAGPDTSKVDALKYQAPGAPSAAAASTELMTVNVRYKQPQSDVSTKLSVVVADGDKPIAQASDDYRFSVAVANVALLLRGSPDVKNSSLASARSLAAGAVGSDLHGDRREFLALIDEAQRLRGPSQGVLKSVAR
jgi:Ca-activated chloride channel homolog